ncbi:MAG TPA: DUF4097 family beta strand repeat-containing protein [Thermotogota bacterium]|nr:DUF4097 family beta strand repeat-containing protein [Thermotogota bacterium]HRW92500.1 DUF4097 family beta strand repeat-containing protein [Thermotogota bacterium]
MQKNRSTTFFVLALVLGMAVVLSSCDVLGVRKEQTFSLQIPAENMGLSELEIDTRNGAISLATWEGNTIKVEGTKYVQGGGDLEKEIQKIQVQSQQQGNRLHVFAQMPNDVGFSFTPISYGAQLNILVPASFARDLQLVEANTSNGRLEVNDCNGLLKLETSNGRIILSRCNGVIDAKTSNGSVDLENLRGQLNVTTSNGSISLVGCSLSGNMHLLDSSNGSISGDISLPDTGTVRVTTSNGRIDLRVPRETRATLSAKTSNGTISTKNLGITFSQDTKTSKRGTINGGGASLELDTSNANITLSGQ